MKRKLLLLTIFLLTCSPAFAGYELWKYKGNNKVDLSVPVWDIDGVFDINTTGTLGAGVSTLSTVNFGSATGVSATASAGVLTLAGIGGTNNENLTFDFETASNKVTVLSGTSAALYFGLNIYQNAGTFWYINGTGARFSDNVTLRWGTGDDASFRWITTGNDNLNLALRCNNAATSGYFCITEYADASNANRSPLALSVDPVLRIYSSDETQALDYLELYHNQTDAVLDWGNGNLRFGTADSKLIAFGAASDATIGFDGNSLNIVANAVTGTDTLNLTAASIECGSTPITTTGTVTTQYLDSDINTQTYVFSTANLGFTQNTQTLTYSSPLSSMVEMSGVGNKQVIIVSGNVNSNADDEEYYSKSFIANKWDITDSSIVADYSSINTTALNGLLIWAGTINAGGIANIYGLNFLTTGNMGVGGTKTSIQALASGTADTNTGISVSATSGTTNYGVYTQAASGTTNWALYCQAGNVFLGQDNAKSYFGTAKDASIYYDATNLVINPKEVGTGFLQSTAVVRTSTSLYSRYYHLPMSAVSPGATGATWTEATANNLAGWQLNASTELLNFDSDVHSDWDGSSNFTVEIFFQLLSAGSAGNTVDLKMNVYYMAVGDSVVKTQSLADVVVVTDGTQYKMYKATFTVPWDAASDIEVGDRISYVLNLETDTSEIDNILVVNGNVAYNTTHVGIETTDT